MNSDAQRIRDLLAEVTGYGDWTHEHCDEDSGGNHRLDREWLDEDAHAAIVAYDALVEAEQA